VSPARTAAPATGDGAYRRPPGHRQHRGGGDGQGVAVRPRPGEPRCPARRGGGRRPRWPARPGRSVRRGSGTCSAAPRPGRPPCARRPLPLRRAPSPARSRPAERTDRRELEKRGVSPSSGHDGSGGARADAPLAQEDRTAALASGEVLELVVEDLDLVVEASSIRRPTSTTWRPAAGRSPEATYWRPANVCRCGALGQAVAQRGPGCGGSRALRASTGALRSRTVVRRSARWAGAIQDSGRLSVGSRSRRRRAYARSVSRWSFHGKGGPLAAELGCQRRNSPHAESVRRTKELDGTVRCRSVRPPPSGRCSLLADIDHQVFIGRLELVPSHVGVAMLTPREMGGEIFDLELDPRPVGGELV